MSGSGATDRADAELAPRRDFYEAYVRYHRESGAARPCDDPALTGRAARLLRSGAERSGRPEWELLGLEPGGERAPEILRAYVKATEVLEKFCINLLLHPWKKEIRTIKTFTGPFVYCLLPALTSSTIRSVLGCIGYIPHMETETNGCITEYKLREDVNPEGAGAVGLELFLARLEYKRLLDMLEPLEPGSQEAVGAVGGRCHHPHNEPLVCPDAKTTEGQEQKEEEEEEEEEKPEEEEEEEGATGGDQKLSKSCFPDDLWQTKAEKVTTAEPTLRLQRRPQRPAAPCSRRLSEDSSIVEMHRNYPDLTIRGHPLLQDKTHKGRSKADYNHSKTLPKSVAAAMRSSDGCKAGIVAGSDDVTALNTESETSGDAPSGNETVAEDAPSGGDLGGRPRVVAANRETQTSTEKPPRG